MGCGWEKGQFATDGFPLFMARGTKVSRTVLWRELALVHWRGRAEFLLLPKI